MEATNALAANIIATKRKRRTGASAPAASVANWVQGGVLAREGVEEGILVREGVQGGALVREAAQAGTLVWEGTQTQAGVLVLEGDQAGVQEGYLGKKTNISKHLGNIILKH